MKKAMYLIIIFLMHINIGSAKVNTNYETAYLAGGCFWGVEDLFRKIPGVKSTDVGYTGGDPSKKSYLEVKLGDTGQAEAVKIVFDPKVTSYGKILDYFFKIHDPTTVNQQGNDIGTQYRSAIFFADEAQKKEGLAAIDRAEKTGRWKKPVVTKLEPFSAFALAEDYHQDYLVKNPQGYTCHWERP